MSDVNNKDILVSNIENDSNIDNTQTMSEINQMVVSPLLTFIISLLHSAA